jgi:hypothetical protein
MVQQARIDAQIIRADAKEFAAKTEAHARETRHVLLPSEHPLGGGCRRHFRTGAALPTRAARSAMA